MKKDSISEKLQDRSSIHMISVLILGTTSFASSLILGKIIWGAMFQLSEYISRVGEGGEIYQQIIILLIQIGLSGFFLFVTPIFFSMILSIMPLRKMLISPYYGQMIVFCVSVFYFSIHHFSTYPLNLQSTFLLTGIGIYLMFASLVQHEIVKKLVGVKMESIIRYSLKVRNASTKQILEVLMNPDMHYVL